MTRYAWNSFEFCCSKFWERKTYINKRRTR